MLIHVLRSRLFELGVCDEILLLCLVGVEGTDVAEALDITITSSGTFGVLPEALVEGIAVPPEDLVEGIAIPPEALVEGEGVLPVPLVEGVVVLPEPLVEGVGALVGGVGVVPEDLAGAVGVVPEDLVGGVGVVPEDLIGGVGVVPEDLVGGVGVTVEVLALLFGDGASLFVFVCMLGLLGGIDLVFCIVTPNLYSTSLSCCSASRHSLCLLCISASL